MYAAVVMGVTSTLTYLGPFLSLPMTITVRLYILGLVQVLMCLMETAETILRQVRTGYKKIFNWS